MQITRVGGHNPGSIAPMRHLRPHRSPGRSELNSDPRAPHANWSGRGTIPRPVPAVGSGRSRRAETLREDC